MLKIEKRSKSHVLSSISHETVSDFFHGEVLETFVILSAIKLPIKSLVAFAVLWNALFEAVLSESDPWVFEFISHLNF